MDALLEVGTSFNSLVALYEGNSDYRQEVPFFKELLYKDEQTYGPDHPDVAWRLNNLADLYRALGRYADAQPLFERALNLLSKTRGPKHPSVGMQILKRNYGDAEVMARLLSLSTVSPKLNYGCALHPYKHCSETLTV